MSVVTTFYGSLAPRGYQQLTSLSSATALTIPSGSKLALLRPAGDVRMRDDGTNPTASVGMLIPDGELFAYNGRLQSVRLIQVSSATLDVLYYG